MGNKAKSEIQKRRARTQHRNEKIEAGVEAVEAAHARGDKRRVQAILNDAQIDAKERSVYNRLNGGKSTTEYAQTCQILSEAEEGQLEAAIIEAALAKCPYRPQDIYKMAFDILQAHDPTGPPPNLSRDWTKRFLTRRNLRSYVGKARSFERNRSTKTETVKDYFDALEESQERFEFDESAKWAMDESPGMLGHGHNTTVVAPEGWNGAHVERSGDRCSYTLVACVCADGTYINPTLIFSAKKHSASWAKHNTSMNVNIAITDSGSMNSARMLDWMQWFEKKTRLPDQQKWRLLLYDLHSTHIDKKVIDWAYQHRIWVMSYPTNATHIFQGLDVSIFGPYKIALEKLKFEYERDNNQTMDYLAILTSLHIPWLAAFTPSNIKSGWSKTGAHPIDRTVVTSDMIAGSKGADVMQVPGYHPALDAIIPLVAKIQADETVAPDLETVGNTFNADMEIDNLDPDTQEGLGQAHQHLSETEFAYLLSSPLRHRSKTPPQWHTLAAPAVTPESIRRRERAGRSKVERTWAEPDFAGAYYDIREANIRLHELLAEAAIAQRIHIASHVIDQAVNKRLKSHLAAKDAKKTQNPVKQLVGTKEQYFLTGKAMRRAIDKHESNMEQDERRKDQTQKRREWKAQEKEAREAQIAEDVEEWKAKHPNGRRILKNPGKRQVEKVPDELADPLMSDHSSEEDTDDEGEADVQDGLELDDELLSAPYPPTPDDSDASDIE